MLLFQVFFFLLLSGVFLIASFKSLFFKKFDPVFLVGIIIGLIPLFLVIFLIISSEKRITFKVENVEIELFRKIFVIEYHDIEFLKFIHPPKDSEFLLMKLKKRMFWKKKFVISVNNKKSDLLQVLNFSRKQGVKTGLNEIGEKYFAFIPKEGKYVLREDKKIDINKLW